MSIQDITKIKELCEHAKLSSMGKIYLGALDLAFNDHGDTGLRMQVAYILSNGRWPNAYKKDRKMLTKYSAAGIFS